MSGTVSSITKAVQGLAAYQTTDASTSPGNTSGKDFASYISGVLTNTVKQGANAETLAQNGLMGNGNLTQVVTSVAQAQLALQTTVAIRDRLITAYQSIMSMPI
ncbi:flagellar hook-basal body complex protein FliE [Acidiphilium sp. PA]|uniref:flagellar hook-basal body complex protein FliE n=1 Tax=Acidiphilium sp. PA TaxID=2871705 RepID=UPI00224395FC|nr:flagellar hook-basal body complex protein FliE [Acidiphilium sp. PA]MCW8305982.1 flagellar hook-basal body complex protein FliE [Acidiphilium sp. PA]